MKKLVLALMATMTFAGAASAGAILIENRGVFTLNVSAIPKDGSTANYFRENLYTGQNHQFFEEEYKLVTVEVNESAMFGWGANHFTVPEGDGTKTYTYTGTTFHPYINGQ